MSNPEKGEVSFEAQGKTWTLRYSIDALCALEEATGKGIIALSRELASPDTLTLSQVRKVVWAGLREHHPDLDLKAAGELIADAGGVGGMLERINTAFERGFPQAEGGDARPPLPGQNGTGPASVNGGAASASTRTLSGGARPGN